MRCLANELRNGCNDDKDQSQNTDYRCADRQVALDRNEEADDARYGGDNPPNGKFCADSIHEISRADGRNNEVSENKQDTADVNEARHDEAEDHVKYEIPPANIQTA